MLKRADVNPAELKDILPEICFFTPVYGDDGLLDDVIVKLQGTRASGFYGEHTGKSVTEHPSSEVAARIVKSVEAAIEQKNAVLAEAATMSADKSYLSIKALYIPMSEDGVLIDQLLVLIRVAYSAD
jgi:hypothetical protein